MNDSDYLDRTTVLEAFRRLALLLRDVGVVGDVYLFGGGAMLMAFDDRAATEDLDARYTSSASVQSAIEQVATEMGLPRWWLNDQGTAYLPRTDDPHGAAVFDHPNLRVMRVSDRHLLAMKMAAARRTDMGDIRLLADRLGLATLGDVEELYEAVFPDEPLSEAKRLVVRDAMA